MLYIVLRPCVVYLKTLGLRGSGLEGVVRLGGDADTNGAVAGALHGARFGVGGIPSGWLRDVEGREDLLRLL